MQDFAADIPYSVAQAAHNGTSWVPERRAKQEQDGYAETLKADYEALSKYANTDEKRALLDQEFARYREGYRKHTCAYLHSRSRVMSAMITGPARFPVARNEKRSDIAHKRLNELLSFRERAIAAIKKKLRPELRPIMTGDANAAERLEDKIAKAEKWQELMKSANATIRKHKKAGRDAQIAALVALGMKDTTAAKLLEPDFCGRIGFPNYELTNNLANIKRMKGRLNVVERNKAAEDTQHEGEKATIEDCPSENRVRLFFPGKPDETVRNTLKSRGFRWTPTLGCWQAYRNPSSLEVAKQIAG